MLIPVEKIGPKGLDLSLYLMVNKARLTEGKASSPIHLKVKIRKKGNLIKAWGKVEGEVMLTCSRCAEEFPFRINSSFSLDLLPLEELSSGEMELEEKDMDTAFYSEGNLDLDALAADQINLSIPMKPLCRPDCKGICPVCGANRNKVDCGHRPETKDPRLSKLKFLLEVKNGTA